MSGATQTIFEMVLARWTEHGLNGLAHLMWRAPQQGDRLVQVYVDDALYDVSVTPDQREMWLHLDGGRPHRIELMAVPVDRPWEDHGHELRGWSPRFVGSAELALVRHESLDVDSRVVVVVDGQVVGRDRLWGGSDARGGFGALLGEGRFGYDDASAPGFAQGDFGAGAFGSDGDAWRWRHDALAAGTRTIDATVVDRAGRTVGAIDPAIEVEVDELPGVARNLRLEPGFVLRWDG